MRCLPSSGQGGVGMLLVGLVNRSWEMLFLS